MTLSFYTNEIEIRRKSLRTLFRNIPRQARSSITISDVANGIGCITAGGDDSISFDFSFVSIHTGLHFGILRG